MDPITEFLNEVDAFRTLNSLSERAFSIMAANDRTFLREIKRGRQVRQKTMEKARAAMAAHAAKEAEIDAAVLARISFNEHISRNGERTSIPGIGFDRVERLVRLGQLRPENDAMFGCTSQTYRVAGA